MSSFLFHFILPNYSYLLFTAYTNNLSGQAEWHVYYHQQGRSSSSEMTNILFQPPSLPLNMIPWMNLPRVCISPDQEELCTKQTILLINKSKSTAQNNQFVFYMKCDSNTRWFLPSILAAQHLQNCPHVPCTSSSQLLHSVLQWPNPSSHASCPSQNESKNTKKIGILNTFKFVYSNNSLLCHN